MYLISQNLITKQYLREEEDPDYPGWGNKYYLLSESHFTASVICWKVLKMET